MSGPDSRNTVPAVSWQTFLAGLKQSQGDIAKAAGVTPPTVSRWMSGQQGVDPAAAAKLARAYKRPVLEAFIAAGFLTEAEANVRPASAPDYSLLTNDELLELVRARMRGEGELGGNTAAIDASDIGPRGRTYPATVKRAARGKGVKK